MLKNSSNGLYYRVEPVRKRAEIEAHGLFPSPDGYVSVTEDLSNILDLVKHRPNEDLDLWKIIYRGAASRKSTANGVYETRIKSHDPAGIIDPKFLERLRQFAAKEQPRSNSFYLWMYSLDNGEIAVCPADRWPALGLAGALDHPKNWLGGKYWGGPNSKIESIDFGGQVDDTDMRAIEEIVAGRLEQMEGVGNFFASVKQSLEEYPEEHVKQIQELNRALDNKYETTDGQEPDFTQAPDYTFGTRFGFVGGRLVFNTYDHTHIMEHLLNTGYDWMSMFATPQLWGSLFYRNMSNGKSLSVNLTTDVGKLDMELRDDLQKKMAAVFNLPLEKVTIGTTGNQNTEDYGHSRFRPGWTFGDKPVFEQEPGMKSAAIDRIYDFKPGDYVQVAVSPSQNLQGNILTGPDKDGQFVIQLPGMRTRKGPSDMKMMIPVEHQKIGYLIWFSDEREEIEDIGIHDTEDVRIYLDKDQAFHFWKSLQNVDLWEVDLTGLETKPIEDKDTIVKVLHGEQIFPEQLTRVAGPSLLQVPPKKKERTRGPQTGDVLSWAYSIESGDLYVVPGRHETLPTGFWADLDRPLSWMAGIYEQDKDRPLTVLKKPLTLALNKQQQYETDIVKKLHTMPNRLAKLAYGPTERDKAETQYYELFGHFPGKDLEYDGHAKWFLPKQDEVLWAYNMRNGEIAIAPAGHEITREELQEALGGPIEWLAGRYDYSKNRMTIDPDHFTAIGGTDSQRLGDIYEDIYTKLDKARVLNAKH